jgi:AcrR family transcriptional regulator
LIEAFDGLVVTSRYREIRVRDILERANVGRSTFYEHYRNKDEVLRTSLAPLLSTFAELVDGGSDVDRLTHVLAHFFENRRLARDLLRDAAARQVARVLRELIETRLRSLAATRSSASIPIRLVASQVAGAQLGVVQAWLAEEAPGPAAAIARLMRDGTRALVKAWRRPEGR